MPTRIRWMSAVLLVAAAMVLTLSWLLTSAAPAKGEEMAGTDAQPGGIFVACPDVVTIHEPDLVALGHAKDPTLKELTFSWWELQRGTTSDTAKMETLTEGTSSSFTYEDRAVTVGQTYYYIVRTLWVGKESKFQTFNLPQTVIRDGCTGTISTGTWSVRGSDRTISYLTVKGTGKLEIGGGARIKTTSPDQSSVIGCNGDQARVDIDDATFDQLDLNMRGCPGSISASRFEGRSRLHFVRDPIAGADSDSSGYLSAGGTEVVTGHVIPLAGNIFSGTVLSFYDVQADFRDNTFTGPFSPQLDPNRIQLWDGATRLARNQGAFGLYVNGNAQATMHDNRFTGYVLANKQARVELTNNVITGSVSVNAYGAAPGLEASATLISNTVVATQTAGFNYTEALRADSGGQLTAVRCRIQRGVGSNHYVLRSFGANKVKLYDTRIRGVVDLKGETEIDMANNHHTGPLWASDQVTGRITANRFDDDMRLKDDARLDFTDNVIGNGTLYLYADVGGDFVRNTFLPAEGDSALQFANYPAPDATKLRIEQNCIERRYGLDVSDMTGTAVVEKNWWGHTTGPTHIRLNPNGQGASLYIVRSPDTAVDFRPILEDRPAYCRTKPPRLPHEEIVMVGPAGGTLLASGIVVVIPPDAVAQDTQVIYQEIPRDSAVQAADTLSIPPTGDQTAVRAFDLSAKQAGTSTPVTQFSEPYSLTVFYDAGDLGSVAESTLGLYSWDGARWAPKPSAQVDAGGKLVTAALDHMSVFALLGEEQLQELYLPNVQAAR